VVQWCAILASPHLVRCSMLHTSRSTLGHLDSHRHRRAARTAGLLRRTGPGQRQSRERESGCRGHAADDHTKERTPGEPLRFFSGLTVAPFNNQRAPQSADNSRSVLDEARGSGCRQRARLAFSGRSAHRKRLSAGGLYELCTAERHVRQMRAE